MIPVATLFADSRQVDDDVNHQVRHQPPWTVRKRKTDVGMLDFHNRALLERIILETWVPLGGDEERPHLGVAEDETGQLDQLAHLGVLHRVVKKALALGQRSVWRPQRGRQVRLADQVNRLRDVVALLLG